MEAILALEDGRFFRGRAFGASGERRGEVVFNTSMTGYQEVLTDPSYKGQIVVMTAPHIGNYGTTAQDSESSGCKVEGFVVREASVLPSNWRATQGLPQYLKEHGIPGISEIDTRALTRHIRTAGAMKAVISTVDRDPRSLSKKARETPEFEDQDLVGQVTCRGRHDRFAHATPGKPRCVAFDFGVKTSILRLLDEAGFDVTVVPARTSAREVLESEADCVFLSNGPGDPAAATYAVEAVRELVGKLPIFGICLGHQIAALALGARTFKLKFGHRGANHPVQDLRTGGVAVTSQNHGYAVDPDTLPDHVEVTHINLNDQTCAGLSWNDGKLLAVQYHPEASPGPHDSFELFREFRDMLEAPRSSGRSPLQEER